VIDTYHSLDSNNLEELESYCLQFAERFFLGDVDWISWSLFSKKLPLERDDTFKDVKKILKKRSHLELSDSTYRYFIFIQDFKLKGTSSPLEYVSSLIRKILINKQKKEVIHNIEYTLIEDAIKNDKFEIYE
jgi:RNA recognition motif-containing protein